MKRVWLACALLLLASTAYAELPRIAVMDFTSTEIHKQYGVKAAELVRLKLINSRDFAVMMKSQVAPALAARDIRFETCFNIECAAKAGRILGASRVVTGTLMKTGSKVIMTGVIVNVATGASEYSESATAPGVNDLNDAAVDLSKKLMRRLEKAVGEDARREAKKKKGTERKFDRQAVPAGGGDYRKKAALAAGTSVFPVWSGSFILGFDGAGLAFTLLKSFSTGCIVYYYGFFIPGYDDYFNKRKSKQKAAEFIYPSSPAPSVSYLMLFHEVTNPKSIDKYGGTVPKALWYIGVIGLPIFTLVDMVYSGLIVTWTYRCTGAMRRGGDDAVSWHFAFRTYETERIFNNNGESLTVRTGGIDGANLEVVFQF